MALGTGKTARQAPAKAKEQGSADPSSAQQSGTCSQQSAASARPSPEAATSSAQQPPGLRSFSSLDSTTTTCQQSANCLQNPENPRSSRSAEPTSQPELPPRFSSIESTSTTCSTSDFIHLEFQQHGQRTSDGIIPVPYDGSLCCNFLSVLFDIYPQTIRLNGKRHRIGIDGRYDLAALGVEGGTPDNPVKVSGVCMDERSGAMAAAMYHMSVEAPGHRCNMRVLVPHLRRPSYLCEPLEFDFDSRSSSGTLTCC